MLALGGVFASPDVAASCVRPKAAAYYIYDFGSDSCLLQGLYDDGVDIGNGVPVDESGQPYESMDNVWHFHAPPEWDGSYPYSPEPYLTGGEGGQKEGSEAALASGGAKCTTLPPVVVSGRRLSPAGVLRLHMVARAEESCARNE
jgi:hypothetical protein